MSKRNPAHQSLEEQSATNSDRTRPPDAERPEPEPARGPLSEALYGMQKRLIAEIESDRNEIRHAAEKGQHIEHRIRTALRSVLPEKVGVSHGFVVDSEGGRSQQMDIILYDRLNCPKIRASGGTAGSEVFPVEATYACGEVKTTLRGDDLTDCFDKCSSYKSLSRIAYYRPHPNQPISTATPFGEALGPERYWESIFFVVALTGTDFEKLLQKYENIVEERRLGERQRIDIAIALIHSNGKKNMLISANKTKESITPEHTLAKIDLTPEPGGRMTDFQFAEPWSVFVGLLLNEMTRVTAQPLDATRYNWYGTEEIA